MLLKGQSGNFCEEKAEMWPAGLLLLCYVFIAAFQVQLLFVLLLLRQRILVLLCPMNVHFVTVQCTYPVYACSYLLKS